jgi:hypothetical protein
VGLIFLDEDALEEFQNDWFGFFLEEEVGEAEET